MEAMVEEQSKALPATMVRRGRPPKRVAAEMFHVKHSGEAATEGNPLAIPPRAEQRQWVLRYKWGNHPAETGLILASTRDLAEAVGRAWCVKKGAGQMQQVRFITVEDPILADESILETIEA